MNGGLVYREGGINDMQKLKEVDIKSYSEFKEVLQPDEWLKLNANLNNEQSLVELINIAKTFVCTCNDEIVGVVFFIPRGNPTPIYDAESCYIRKLGVHPLFRGRGIARQLTKMCIDHAVQLKEPAILLHTSEMMDAARHIYESIGFKRHKDIDPIFGKQYWLYKLDLDTSITS